MRVLLHKDPELRRVRGSFDKIRAAIEADDFRTADVKKLHAGPYYRAKLDYASRLLLQFAHVSGATACLALEVIENHAYYRSRFLRGALVDEAKIEHEAAVQPAASPPVAVSLRWLHDSRTQFHLLDKSIVFDDTQEDAYRLAAPLVLIGSAGSGKTAVTLAKLLVRRTIGALRQRHLAPYAAKNTKDLMRLADVHGVDHRSLVGARPLMLAARAGNATLAQALLDRGADPALRDEFGQTAWHHALCRALEDPNFARSGLAALFDILAPTVLDVQTAGRLVRLERHQGEYWVLMLMVAGLKTQWSACAMRAREVWKYRAGFFAYQLNDVLASLPAWLWPQKRRKRGYVNQVLARAEAGRPYRPARQLWVRCRHATTCRIRLCRCTTATPGGRFTKR